MPTGYTADIAAGKNVTLRDYALECARALGALVTMRDDPMGTPIPKELEPNTKYHDEALAEARAERDRIYAMMDDEIIAENEKEIAEDKVYCKEQKKKIFAQRQRYIDMINKVSKWQGAPEGLKPFMLQQLESSIEFDCPPDPLQYHVSPKLMSVEEWKQAKLKKIQSDIDYHERERTKEITRTEASNRWLKQLWTALEGVE